MNIEELNRYIEGETTLITNVREEIKKVIIGQSQMVDKLLIALLCIGHVLLEGLPGLAKTLTIKTLATLIQGSFKRLQFTPDLLPADIVGTMVYNQKNSEFYTRKGPLFANIILADEINRAPAKVQSALLEAMQEKQVTIGDETFHLPSPFFVLATQNPIEHEGTYPLPEAQIDRFMMKIEVSYPTKKEEKDILNLIESQLGNATTINHCMSIDDILRLQKTVNQIYIDDKLKNYIVDIVSATRSPGDYGLSKFTPLIEYGASPRASIALLQASKAYAFLQKRGYVIPDDIKVVAYDVLRHRLVLTYEAEAESITTDKIVAELLKQIEVP